MEDTKKTNPSKEPRKLGDLYEEICSTQAKAIAVLEENVRLLHMQIELKEKMFKMELEAYNAFQVPPIQNGTLKIVEAPTK